MNRALKTFALVASIALIALLGCGDPPGPGNGSGSTNDGPGPGNGVDRYDDIDDDELIWALIAEASCVMAWDCPQANAQAASISDILGRFSTKEQCLDGAQQLFAQDMSPEEQQAVEQGRIVVDRSQLAECRQQLLDVSCDTGLFDDTGMDIDEDHPCELLYAGQQQEGDYCNASNECAGDLACHFEADGVEDACYGVCTPPDTGQMGTCGDEECDADQYCDYSGEEPTCVARGGVGDTCSHDGQCQRDYFCSASDECAEVVIRAEGEGCEVGENFCAASTSCQGANGQQCAPVVEEGESCHALRDCTFGLACIGADADDPGSCEAPQIGDPCAADDICAQGYCDNAECVPHHEEGESCFSNRECEEGTVCDFEAGECAAADFCELPDD